MGEYYGWRWEFDVCISDIESWIHGGQIAEIGCGEGVFLSRLREIGNAVVGADINGAAVKKAREKGLSVVEGGVETLLKEFPHGSCDGVVIFHVLEHVADPSLFLRELLRILRPGGWVFASVPNPDRAVAKLLSEAWDEAPHHLTRFSKEGFCRLLERSGMRLSGVRVQPLDITSYRLASLCAEARTFPPGSERPSSRLERCALKAKPFLQSLPAAIMACRGSSGTAMYAAGKLVPVRQ
jgi:SAM-dependent methyltransferase